MAGVLQEGIAAAKAGRRSEARRLLLEAAKSPVTAENAWLWLSGVVERDEERLFCLDNALHLNPDNEPARHGATNLRQKGIFPAPLTPDVSIQPGFSEYIPAFSEHQNQVKPFGQTTPTSSLDESHNHPITQAPASTSGIQKGRVDNAGLYRMAAAEFTRNVLPVEVVKNLVGYGISEELARKIVGETQRALKKNRRDRFRRQMVRGLLWTMAGGLVTCGSYLFASNLGGTYYLCWGAIIFGLIDFIIGWVRWIAAR